MRTRESTSDSLTKRMPGKDLHRSQNGPRANFARTKQAYNEIFDHTRSATLDQTNGADVITGHDFSNSTKSTSPRDSRKGLELPSTLKSPMERYFETPLDAVRVHSDTISQTAASELNARAFTVGNDIYIGPEGARLDDSSRAALLAHEVVHTLQQNGVNKNSARSVGNEGGRFENQADRLSLGFTRFNQNPNDPFALHVRDVSNVVSSSDAPSMQFSKVSTHFGDFEDFRYENITDSAGAAFGVEMNLKFHPGTNANADQIGLTQAAEGKENGKQIVDGNYGAHSATKGAGVGYFVDRVVDRINPLFGTENLVNAGGNASNLGDYKMQSPKAIAPADQKLLEKQSGIYGRHFTAGSTLGYRKVVGGSFVTQSAELNDHAVWQGSGANSEQVFETTALAVAGAQKGTYYGSVQWGWRMDAKGAFSRVPFRVVSQGVPSDNFLTTANLWNQSKASFGLVATVATNLVAPSLMQIAVVPINSELVPTGRGGRLNGVAYLEVTFNGNTGLVVSTAVRQASIGAETIDLPVPVIHKVSNPNGTTLILSTPLASLNPSQPPVAKMALPVGTRITTTRCMKPTSTLPNHYEGKVVDGQYIGTKGYFFVPDLQREDLGTH